MKNLFIMAGIVFAGLSFNSVASHGMSSASAQPSAACAVNHLPQLDCAPAPSAAFSDDGRLWVAWSYAGHVYVNYSTDKGKTFSPPVSVNSIPEKISARGENRPKIALKKMGPKKMGSKNTGAVYVTWTTPLKKRFSGNIRFSYSHDNGKHFSSPVTINDNRDITGHRFDALSVAKNGNIYIAWLDKRDRYQAEKKAEKYPEQYLKKYNGAAVYYTWSDNAGKSFYPDQKIIDHSCECCRVVMQTDSKNLPVIVWRNIYGKNTRDHALVNFSAPHKPAVPVRVSYDNWQVDACPHHGPDLSVSDSDEYHLVWFNNADKNHGLFYQRMNSKEKFNEPLAFGNYKAAASHPSVISHQNKVWLSWKEFDGKKESLWMQFSADKGDSWNKPVVVAETTEGSDYGFLLKDSNTVYIQWKTNKDGFQLLAVDTLSGHSQP